MTELSCSYFTLSPSVPHHFVSRYEIRIRFISRRFVLRLELNHSLQTQHSSSRTKQNLYLCPAKALLNSRSIPAPTYQATTRGHHSRQTYPKPPHSPPTMPPSTTTTTTPTSPSSTVSSPPPPPPHPYLSTDQLATIETWTKSLPHSPDSEERKVATRKSTLEMYADALPYIRVKMVMMARQGLR